MKLQKNESYINNIKANKKHIDKYYNNIYVILNHQ